jgi:hypothetical protein
MLFSFSHLANLKASILCKATSNILLFFKHIWMQKRKFEFAEFTVYKVDYEIMCIVISRRITKNKTQKF